MTKADAKLMHAALEGESNGVPHVVNDADGARALKLANAGFAEVVDGQMTVTDAGREAYQETLKRA